MNKATQLHLRELAAQKLERLRKQSSILSVFTKTNNLTGLSIATRRHDLTSPLKTHRVHFRRQPTKFKTNKFCTDLRFT